MSEQELRALLRESYEELKRARARVAALEAQLHEPIAIVSMACRFPGGVRAPEDLSRLLQDGRSAIGAPPRGRGPAGATAPGGYLDDVEMFDPAFFEMSAQEACAADPQQRLLLEVAWEAFERAGVPRGAARGARVGVFVGAIANEYVDLIRAAGPTPHAVLGAMLSSLCGRVSYFFGLTGPSVALDAGCASSLVAVHTAAQALRRGECDAALAGATHLILRDSSAAMAGLGVLSRGGRCRPFDASADGSVRGEGCALVLLKRLRDAVRDGDPILAVLRGSAANHAGATNGMTAPSAPAQEAVIRAALADARLEPAAVDYVECHGTGTLTGDAIEAQALGAVYGPTRRVGAPLLLGSVKGALGHAEPAAGMASLIKVVCCLREQRLLATPVETPSPLIPWDQLRLAPVSRQGAWEARGASRVAGVHGYSMTGANAHLVIEEAPAPATAPQPERRAAASALPVLLSGHTDEASLAQADLLLAWLAARPDLALDDVAWSLAHTRTHLGHRLAVVARSRAELFEALRSLRAPGAAAAGDPPLRGPVEMLPEIVWAFPGGDPWPGMGSELYATHPGFREVFDGVAQEFGSSLGEALRAQVAGVGAAPKGPRPGLTAPLGFALQVALARMLRRWGVAPDGLVAEGRGLIAAACVAEALDVAAGCRLIAALPPTARPLLPRECPAALSRALDGLSPRAPSIAMFDGSSGRPILATHLASAAGWWDLLLGAAAPASTAAGMGPVTVCVTLGPGEARWSPPAGRAAPLRLAALREGRSEWSGVLEAIAALHVHGVEIRWPAFFGPVGGRRVELPTYGWQRRRCWIDEGIVR